VHSVIQHNIPEVANLQMEGVLFWYFILCGCCVSTCLCAGGDQRKNLWTWM